MPNDPALCTESANPNYTIATFALYVTPSGEAEFNVGNIQTGGFQHTPNVFEHRRGIDNSLDMILRIGVDYMINFTADEITTANLAMMLNETPVPTAGGCRIPLTGDRCVTEYGARLVHVFPCATKTLTIDIWRAVILGDFTLTFDPADVASFPGVIRALYCGSIHPSEPYGRIEIDEACPWS